MELKGEILKAATLSQKVAGTEIADFMTENELVARAGQMCRSRTAFKQETWN